MYMMMTRVKIGYEKAVILPAPVNAPGCLMNDRRKKVGGGGAAGWGVGLSEGKKSIIKNSRVTITTGVASPTGR
jgi:hypothetical protein